jgi:hypothetical protein
MSEKLMADPSPSNIDGSKTVSHTFEHQIRHQVNWSHVALAVAGLAVVYVLFVRGGGEIGDAEDGAGSPTQGFKG